MPKLNLRWRHWKRIPRWLGEAQLFWLFAGAIVVAGLIGELVGVFADSSRTDRIRYAGYLLQVCGLIAAAVGLSKKLDLFHGKSVWRLFGEAARGWLSRFPLVRQNKHIAAGTAHIRLAPMTAEGYGKVKIDPNKSAEDKINWLLERYYDLVDIVQQSQREIKANKKEGERQLRELRATLEENIGKVEAQTASAHVGGIGVEFVGLGWILCGITFATVPEFVEAAFGWPIRLFEIFPAPSGEVVTQSNTSTHPFNEAPSAISQIVSAAGVWLSASVSKLVVRIIDVPAASWAAVAAFFSAFSSLMLVRIHIRNQREAIRPDIIVSGWTRVDNEHANTSELSAEAFINVGQGHATSLIVNCDDQRKRKNEPPISVMGTKMIAFLPKDSTEKFGDRILIYWKNVPKVEKRLKPAAFQLTMRYLDNQYNQYVVTYDVFMVKEVQQLGAGPHVAPGTAAVRTTAFAARWRLRFVKRFRKVPFLRAMVARALLPKPVR